jgi:hypothetical protein
MSSATKKTIWLLLLVLTAAFIVVVTPGLSHADPLPPSLHKVIGRLMASSDADVTIPYDGEWVTLSLEIDDAPLGATVASVALKVDLVHPVPDQLQARLVAAGVEVPLEPGSGVNGPDGTMVWSLLGVEGFVGLPVEGTWSLMVRGPRTAPPAPASTGPSGTGDAYIDRVVLRVHFEAEMPITYQVTDGVPGRPAAKRCEVCSQLLEPAPLDDRKPQASLPLIPRTASGWRILETEGLEHTAQWSGKCQILYDGSADGLRRTWGGDDDSARDGGWATWLVREGEAGKDPLPPAGHPDSPNSWMVCGPFDLSDASNAYVAFWLWSQIAGEFDEFFFGIGFEPDDWFYGYAWDSSVTSWAHHTVYFPGYTGRSVHDSMWFAWNVESEYSTPADLGPWVDDIEIAKSLPCPVVSPGWKGLQVHPNELPGQVQKIEDADTHWVRLEFKMEPDGSLDLAKYAGIVDSLCQHGMAVIGLVDYVTIPEDLDGDGQKDYDDPEGYIAYQQQFTETVEVLANHFRGSIGYWEVWNEENGQQWHVPPEYYARLLVKVSEVVKEVDAANNVLFGGLDHVWVTSQYLEPVYDALDLDWDGARPFDILGVHPYFVVRQGQYILDPNVYLWDDGDPPHTTLDAYLAYMASRGDGDTDIWVTEIGWNSALDNPAIIDCPGIIPWCVTRAAQAQYLQDSFDILLKEVEDPQGNHDRVGAVVWYQYQDTGSTLAEMAAKLSLSLDALAYDPQTVCPADWGLVDGSREPKPSYWAYQAYRRHWAVYVPVVVRSDPGRVSR